MCGIFFSLARHGHIPPHATTAALLRNRGPDHTALHHTVIHHHPSTLQPPPIGQHHPPLQPLHATFLFTVLSLRGTALVPQPLIHAPTASVLCWNGEAWSINSTTVTGNDAQLVFDQLLDTCSTAPSSDRQAAVVHLLSTIRGPYAIVFYDAVNNHLYYGRDCLGRRSLLRKDTHDGSLVLSSVCDNVTGEAWTEVEADGLYVIDLTQSIQTSGPFHITHVPHVPLGAVTSGLAFTLPFPPMNHDLNHDSTSIDDSVDAIHESLQLSVSLRTQHVREAVSTDNRDPKIAILFSGGLDCTILARLCHDLLPLDQPIDLLNVAFENPRIHSNLDSGTSPYELCPDRITGRSSHAELEQVCPGRRWRFVQINVPYTDTVAHRSTVMSLMHPHNTEMDLSISYALYFASRGIGVTSPGVDTTSPLQPYTTSASVLLSGLGADELFGGYQRHATAFARHSYAGLLEELTLDFSRLGKRNLGRDDRVISNSHKEVRFPYLDESFIALALQLPVAIKCDFGTLEYSPPDDPSTTIEPAKRILRLLAHRLGMPRVATEKKRAIQFGARTAKMETGKTKGTHVLS